jgi:hypothetical protein
MTRLEAVPMDLEGANEFVSRHHRHHKPVVGHKFSIGAALDGNLIGVVIVGRPVARRRDDGETLEVTRLATDGIARPTGKVNRRGEPTFHNPCSLLYAAAARAAFALGYRRIGTYIRSDEPGTSLGAAGWRMVASTPGRSWSVPSRPRKDQTDLIPRLLFERTAP